MATSQPAPSRAPTLAERVRAYAATAAFQKLWRYGTVSVVTTILSLGFLYLFFRVVKVDPVSLGSWHLGSAEMANVYATAISTIPSYYLNRSWAWGKSGKSHLWREVIPFWVIAALSLVLSTLVVGVASREAHRLSSRHEVQTILVEAGNLATYGAMWIAKFFIFNRLLFHQAPLAEPVDPTGEAGELHRYGAEDGTSTGPLNGRGALAEESVVEAR